MSFEARYENGLSVDVFEDDKKVAEIGSFKKGVSTIFVADNIADILNLRSPRHTIKVGANPHYVSLDHGFEIRIKDENVIGQKSVALTVSIEPEFQDRLKGRFTADFFAALCSAMPAPEKPQPSRKRAPAMA